jgi:hypothetical protein
VAARSKHQLQVAQPALLPVASLTAAAACCPVTASDQSCRQQHSQMPCCWVRQHRAVQQLLLLSRAAAAAAPCQLGCAESSSLRASPAVLHMSLWGCSPCQHRAQATEAAAVALQKADHLQAEAALCCCQKPRAPAYCVLLPTLLPCYHPAQSLVAAAAAHAPLSRRCCLTKPAVLTGRSRALLCTLLPASGCCCERATLSQSELAGNLEQTAAAVVAGVGTAGNQGLQRTACWQKETCCFLQRQCGCRLTASPCVLGLQQASAAAAAALHPELLPMGRLSCGQPTCETPAPLRPLHPLQVTSQHIEQPEVSRKRLAGSHLLGWPGAQPLRCAHGDGCVNRCQLAHVSSCCSHLHPAASWPGCPASACHSPALSCPGSSAACRYQSVQARARAVVRKGGCHSLFLLVRQAV